MKYIYHNTQTKEMKSYPNNRRFEGVVTPPWEELIYKTMPKPPWDPDTERLIQGWVITEGKYMQTWHVQALSDYEIAMRSWLYPHRDFKIKAPKHYARTMPQMVTWFQINQFEIDTDTDVYFAYIYVNEILEDDKPLLKLPEIELFEKPKIQDYD